jgi:hypothetical protein
VDDQRPERDEQASGEPPTKTGGGTVNVIGGELQNYYSCPGNGFLLYGYPQHSGSIWTILEQKNGSSRMTDVPIAKAYY